MFFQGILSSLDETVLWKTIKKSLPVLWNSNGYQQVVFYLNHLSQLVISLHFMFHNEQEKSECMPIYISIRIS